jgi:hypothetical protein
MEPQCDMPDLVLVPGPLESAYEWLAAVLEQGDLEGAWPVTDPNLRLALVQSWIWSSRSKPPVSNWSREELARGLTSGRTTHPLWPLFADRQVEKLRAWWGNPRLDEWGATIKGRMVPSEYELIRFSPIGARPGSRLPKPSPLRADGRLVLVRCTAEQWVVAGFDRTPPIPGWPPKG